MQRFRAHEQVRKGPSFKSAVSLDRLRETWRSMRSECRRLLVRDPLDYAAFEAQREAFIKELWSALRTSRYRPCATTLVRSAKRAGLTRPLQFLDITDAIVIESCARALQPRLHEGMPSCVFYGRKQKEPEDEAGESYDTWFDAWLRRDKQMLEMLEDQRLGWVVKADIGNFFPTVSHRLLRQLVATRTGAEQSLIDLVFYLLEQLTWRPDYTQNRETGLPQLSHDASRVLAHAFVGELDEAFDAEISKGRYVRWVDDVVFAVETQRDTMRVLSRFEEALNRLGLFPNAAKCQAVPARDFAAEMCVKENGYLDRVHAFTDGEKGITPVRRHAFDRHAREHVDIDPADRLGTWDRILRRYYTEARRMESPALEDVAVQHIREMPETTMKVLDYLRGRPFSRDILKSLFRYLWSEHNVYQDVEILIWDFICEWRIPSEYAKQYRLADKAMDHFFGRGSFRAPLTEYARGLMELCGYKYGTKRHLDELRDELLRRTAHDPWVVRYGVCVLAGSPEHRDSAFELASRHEDRPLRRIHSFLNTARNAPHDVGQVLRESVRAHDKHVPDYKYLPARMLPLVSLAREHEDFRKSWDAHLRVVLKELQETPADYRDERSIDLISRELQRG